MCAQQNGVGDSRYWQNRMAEDSYQDTREIQKTEAKEMIRGNAKLALQMQKAQLRQREEEEKRGVYEEVTIGEDGNTYIVTRNLQIETKAREVTNMRFPRMYCAARRSCVEEYIFILDCQISGKSRIVYFDPRRIGSGTYILGKMAAAGIEIYAEGAREKEYARKMLCQLVKYAAQTVIPDEPGWIEADGKFSFIPEGSMTWREIKKLL